MYKNSALTARCDYAMFLILGDSRNEDRLRALATAERCGYNTYPDTMVPAYFHNEKELLQAYQTGWAKAQEDHLPRTKEALAAIIRNMDEAANRGCGLFYELYAQNFTAAVDHWLPSLREGELDIVRELLKSTAYEPDTGGHWEYDVEENDITFVPD